MSAEQRAAYRQWQAQQVEVKAAQQQVKHFADLCILMCSSCCRHQTSPARLMLSPPPRCLAPMCATAIQGSDSRACSLLLQAEVAAELESAHRQAAARQAVEQQLQQVRRCSAVRCPNERTTHTCHSRIRSSGKFLLISMFVQPCCKFVAGGLLHDHDSPNEYQQSSRGRLATISIDK